MSLLVLNYTEIKACQSPKRVILCSPHDVCGKKKPKILVIVCYYHVTYVFQSESTLYGCLNVKEVFAWNRHNIWSLSDINGIRTQNHLVWNEHSVKLANWLNGWVFIYEISGCGLESVAVIFVIAIWIFKHSIYFMLDNKSKFVSSASFSLLNALRIRWKKPSFLNALKNRVQKAGRFFPVIRM